jgi:uncharacterized protein (TIRG00374 family)
VTLVGLGPLVHRLARGLTGPAGRIALSLGVVVAVFAFALPQIADYSDAWALVQGMSSGEIAVLVVVGLANLLSYSALWVAALPGLRWRHAVMVEEASTAVSNTVPVGFAFGVGTIAAMFTSLGHAPGAIARAIATTGVWNNLVKLAAPVLALLALAVGGEATGGLAPMAVVGVAVLTAAVALLVLAVHSAAVARWLGRSAQRLATPVLRSLKHDPHDWADRADRFRADSEELVRRRWVQLSLAAVISHGLLFLVLLACLRFVGGVGADVSWPAVLAVFAITRLVTIVPITPGAVGVAELSYVAGLAAVGVPAAAAAGAVLVFRFLTWFLPIPVGAACWLLWRRGAGRTVRAGAPALSRATP